MEQCRKCIWGNEYKILRNENKIQYRILQLKSISMISRYYKTYCKYSILSRVIEMVQGCFQYGEDTDIGKNLWAIWLEAIGCLGRVVCPAMFPSFRFRRKVALQFYRAPGLPTRMCSGRVLIVRQPWSSTLIADAEPEKQHKRKDEIAACLFYLWFFARLCRFTPAIDRRRHALVLYRGSSTIERWNAAFTVLSCECSRRFWTGAE